MSMSELYDPCPQFLEGLPASAHKTLRILQGSIGVPPETPRYSQAIGSLANALLTYAAILGPCKPEIQELKVHCAAIVARASELHNDDSTPLCHMHRAGFPGWTLALSIKPHHDQLQIALGAEVMNVCTQQMKVNEKYAANLLRDLDKLSEIDARDALTVEDSAALGFGKNWFGHFRKIDQQLRRLFVDPDAEIEEPASPYSRHPLIEASLLASHVQPSINARPTAHQGGVLNHRAMPVEQFLRVCNQVRLSAVRGCAVSLVQATRMLTGLSTQKVMRLPVTVDGITAHIWVCRINLSAGTFELNLDLTHPNMARPTPETAHLFHSSSSVVRSPIPAFLLTALRARAASTPQARVLGDLVDWVQPESAQNLLPIARHRISPTIARALNAVPLFSLHTGQVSRFTTGMMRWDFNLFPVHRIYYQFLPAEQIQAEWGYYLAQIGWPAASETLDNLHSVGSHVALTTEGAAQVIGHWREKVASAYPGKNGGLDRILDHHNAYATYVAGVVAFCGGMRAAKRYDLTADRLHSEACYFPLNDKAADRWARPVVVNAHLRRHLDDWIAHLDALIPRLHRLTQGSNYSSIVKRVAQIKCGEGVSLFFTIRQGRIHDLGSVDVWDSLPPHLRVPANAGRHFWPKQLAEAGLSSFCLDVFLRHVAQALDTQAMIHGSSLEQHLRSIEAAQDDVLGTLLPQRATGLRSAA